MRGVSQAVHLPHIGFLPERGDGGDVGKGGGCGHSHVIRLTGPNPFMQILLMAQRLSLVVASWHFAIPDAQKTGGWGLPFNNHLCVVSLKGNTD